MAEASLDTDLFASPGGEAELAIDPVAWMESSACSVFKILVGHDRQVRIDGTRTYRYSGGGRNEATKTTLADQRWPVVSSNETMAGTDKCCQAVNATSTQFDER